MKSVKIRNALFTKKKLPLVKRYFGLTAGISMITLRLQSELPPYHFLDNAHFENHIFPVFGALYKVSMLYLNENLYFQFEGTFSQININGTSQSNSLRGTYSLYHDLTIQFSSINSLGIVRHEFPKGKYRPVFLAGGFVNYFLSERFDRVYEARFPNGETYFRNEKSEYLEDFNYGIALGAGIKTYISKRQMFLDFRYQRGFHLLDFHHSNQYSLNLGLLFGK